MEVPMPMIKQAPSAIMTKVSQARVKNRGGVSIWTIRVYHIRNGIARTI